MIFYRFSYRVFLRNFQCLISYQYICFGLLLHLIQ